MTLREALNLAAFIFLALLLASLGLMSGAIARDHGLGTMEGIYLALCALPWVLALVTGQAYGTAFLIGIYSGGSGAAKAGYSREKSWARQGRGQEAAHALLWRDRLVGDVPGLLAVLEMAQLDPSLKPEAARAARRLMGSARATKAERDHAGRLYQLARLSEVRQNYPGSR